MMKAIRNGILIVPDETGHFCSREGLTLLYDEKIRAIRPEGKDAGHADLEEVYDAGGAYVAPGFLNVHIHGCDGADTMDADSDALDKMSLFQARTGVTAYLPTTMTCAFSDIAHALCTIRHAMHGDAHGARVLGCHMEGPFIAPSKKGAQDAAHILPADFSTIEPYADVIKIITVAPETLPDDAFIKACTAHGIVVSIGHTAADYETTAHAIEAGAHHITHLCNAMTGLHHRRPGVLGAALDSTANCELICDNVHLHPTMQRIIYHAKGGKHLILITDSLRACGLGDGPSELGGQKVTVRGTLATLADGTIAGSVLCLNDGLRIFRTNTGAPIPSIIEMVTRTPAKELGLYDEIGSLSEGKTADFAIFDRDFRMRRTVVGGTTYYKK